MSTKTGTGRNTDGFALMGFGLASCILAVAFAVGLRSMVPLAGSGTFGIGCILGGLLERRMLRELGI